MKNKSSHRQPSYEEHWAKKNLADLDWELGSLQDQLGWLDEGVNYDIGVDGPGAAEEDAADIRDEARYLKYRIAILEKLVSKKEEEEHAAIIKGRNTGKVGCSRKPQGVAG